MPRGTATRLESGGFNCSVDVIEPNGGTGEPRLFAPLSFGQQLNLTGTAGASIFLDSGSKDELNKSCEELAERLSSTAEDLGCTAGPIRTVQTVGGNLVSDSSFFDLICNGDRSRVVDAVGILVEDVIVATQPDQATIQEKTAEQVDLSLWERFQLMRGQANGSTPVIRRDSSSEAR